MKIINKILLTILICCGAYTYVSAQNSDCAASCADIMAGAPADCGAVVNLASAGIPPGSTAQPEFGGDGSAAGCQEWVDVTDFSPIPGEPPAPGVGSVFTLCSSWTATLPDAAFPNFEGVVTAQGATACFAGQTVAVFDAATCAPAGTVTQPDPTMALAGQVTGLTIGTTYVVCTTYDYTNATDINGVPGCVPDAAQLTAEICSEVVEFGTPPLDPCTAVADGGPAYACSGSDFTVPLDIAGGCTTDPTFDDMAIFGVAVQSGYIAFYYVDAAGAFVACPPGSTADDVLANLNPPAGTPGFVFFGESNAGTGGGCNPVEIGAFNNPTCDPIDIPICLLNGDVLNFFVAFDSDGDGVNDISCEVTEITATIYPNIETAVVADAGCDNSAHAFVTDGMGGIIGDLDGDGVITPLDACGSAVLGGDPLDPAFDPANTADDCADGSTLDYDFTPAFVAGDANYPGCVEPLTGTLTCVCDGPPMACTAAPDPGPGYACSGSDFTLPLDVAGACTTDPSFDIFPTDGTAGVSGYIAFYYVDAAGNFVACPPGSNADDVLGNLNPPAGTPGFVFFGESNAGTGGGCNPVEIGAFNNPTCDPIDIPVCLLNGDVTQFVVAFDTDGDGTNDISCAVYETTVTIYPNIETAVVADMGCDNSAHAFVTDGMGGIIGDLDGDGIVTPADACGSAVLGGDPLDPAYDPANTADDCTDGDTLPYDFTPAYVTGDANYPGCVEPLTGTLTCACGGPPPGACVSDPIASPALACQGEGFQVELDAACVTDPNFDLYPTDGTVGVSGWIAFNYVDAAGVFTNCPAGSTADDVLANLNPPAGTAGFVFFGESNAANGGGCSPIDIGAFTNTTCAPIDVPICLLNGDVNTFVVAFDTDGDGVNDVSCDVYETMVTIYPTLTTAVVDDGSSCGTPSVTLVDADGNVCETETAAAACAANDETFTTDFASTATGMTMANAPGAACALPAEVTVTCAGCDPDACSITVTIDDAVCDPATDTYTITYTVNGTNGTTWSSDQGDAGAAYPSTVTATGVAAAAGGMWTINVTDDTDAMCTGTASTPIEPCSMGGTCEIIVTITNDGCTDPDNTPDDQSDDVTNYTITITSTGGSTWSGTVDGNSLMNQAYPYTISGSLTGLGTISVNVTDDADAMCTATGELIIGGCGMTNIPTLSQWGLMTLALMLMIFGALKLGSVSSLSTSLRKR